MQDLSSVRTVLTLMPFMQKAVEEDYDRLESDGIIDKVEYSDWATPMVHIPKRDGTTRSCEDYSVTVNPSFSVPQYPIPLPEDVFRKMAGGQRYTKLDLTSVPTDASGLPDPEVCSHQHPSWPLPVQTSLPFGIASSPAIVQ